MPGGPESAWIVPLALLSPVALLYLAAAAGALLARLAPRLLGPSPAERLAASSATPCAWQSATASRASCMTPSATR